MQRVDQKRRQHLLPMLGKTYIAIIFATPLSSPGRFCHNIIQKRKVMIQNVQEL